MHQLLMLCLLLMLPMALTVPGHIQVIKGINPDGGYYGMEVENKNMTQGIRDKVHHKKMQEEENMMHGISDKKQHSNMQEKQSMMHGISDKEQNSKLGENIMQGISDKEQNSKIEENIMPGISDKEKHSKMQEKKNMAQGIRDKEQYSKTEEKNMMQGISYKKHSKMQEEKGMNKSIRNKAHHSKRKNIRNKKGKGQSRSEHLMTPFYLEETNEVELIWNDKYSGAPTDCSIWRPSPREGWYSLGHIAVSSWDKPTKAIVLKPSDPDMLRQPQDYEHVWIYDHGWFGYPLTIWEPICPEGYIALGHAATSKHKPTHDSQDNIYCVKSEYTLEGNKDNNLRLVWLYWISNGWFYGSSIGPFWIDEAIAVVPSNQQALKLFMFGNFKNPYLLNKKYVAPFYLEETGEVERIWKDKYSGAPTDCSIWRPSPREGYHSLGHIAVSSWDKPTKAIILKPSDPDMLRQPQDYEHVWTYDHGWLFGYPLKIWKAICPEGYIALGHAATEKYKPTRDSQDTIYCVKTKYTVKGNKDNWKDVWNYEGGTNGAPVSIYEAIAVVPSNQQAVKAFMLGNYPEDPYLLITDYASTCQCGVANLSPMPSRQKRIYGGGEVKPKRKYPWVVGLVKKKRMFCGGSIISEHWILTAAHCICKKLPPAPCEIRDINEFKVWVGVHNQEDGKEVSPDKKKYSIQHIFKYHDYKVHFNQYDFALLKLTEPIPFNNIIRPICYNEDDSKDYVGEFGISVGWGRTQYEKTSDYLKEVEMIISICGITTNICVGGEDGKGFSYGDSGGPLMVFENNKYVLVGVAAYGPYPEIAKYGKVSTPEIQSWITETMSSDLICYDL